MMEVSEVPNIFGDESGREFFRQNEVPVLEVRKRVKPEGVCSSLGDISVLQDEISAPTGSSQRVVDFYSQLTPQILEIRTYLNSMMSNDALLDWTLHRNPNENISREQLQQVLGLREGYGHFITRLFFILNHNVDPELIVIPLEKYREAQALPEEMIDVLYQETRLLMKFVTLITNDTFIQKFNRHSPGLEAYGYKLEESTDISDTENILREVNNLIELWVSSVREKTDDKVATRVEEALHTFFNTSGEKWPREPEVGGDTLSNIHNITNHTYIQLERYSSIGKIGKTPLSMSENFLDCFQAIAIAVERGRYLIRIFEEVKQFYEQVFPEVFLDAQVDFLEFADAKKPWLLESETPCGEANGSWNSEEKRIEIISPTVVKATTSEDLLSETTIDIFGNGEVTRKVSDIIVMIHEYSHAVYEAHVKRQVNRSEIKVYQQTADHAINEGFAVLMELLGADYAVSMRDYFQFSDLEIQQIEQWKTSRLFKLKTEKNAYTEGLFMILHKVFLRGAGRGESRDVAGGLLGVRDFLQVVDSSKALALKRSSDLYKAALKKGDPDEWKRLLSLDK